MVVLGFLYGIILSNKLNNIALYTGRLIFVLIVFEFLAYQARYQINDIRGLKEDKEIGCKGRLLSDEIDNPGHIIKISFIVAFIKIMLSVVMVIFQGGEIRNFLLISLGILFGSTILYETARANKNTWLIFVLVGTGYPLRFLIGFFSILPLETTVHSIQMVCLIFALWSYGSFSSILAWTNEVIERMQKVKKNNNSFPVSYEKKHFEDIQNIIMDRYILGEKYPINGKIIPLREKCRLRDPWNLTMVLCIACLFFIACLGKVPKFLSIMELAVCITFIINIYLRYKKKVILMCIGWICIIGKIIISILYYKISIWYFLLSIVQMIITITYFILSYQPQVQKIDYKIMFCKIKRGIMIRVLGEYAYNIMDSEKNSKI